MLADWDLNKNRSKSRLDVMIEMWAAALVTPLQGELVETRCVFSFPVNFAVYPSSPFLFRLAFQGLLCFQATLIHLVTLSNALALNTA